MELQSKPQPTSEPLIYLNDHSIAIYPESIVQYHRNKEKSIASSTTLPTLN